MVRFSLERGGDIYSTYMYMYTICKCSLNILFLLFIFVQLLDRQSIDNLQFTTISLVS